MRVLHLTPELPHAQGGGGGRGHEYFMCRRLVELGHQVLNISPVLPAEAHYAEDLREAGVENWVSLRPESHLREAVQAVMAEPRILTTAVTGPVRALEMRIFWLELRQLVERAIREWRPDVVVVVHGMAAAWANGLPESAPAVIGLHDLQWHWYLQRAQRRRGPSSLVLRGEAERYRRHVVGLLPRYRAAIALSTIEAAELRATTGIPVSVIPVGVDTATLRPAPEQEGPPRLVFTGTLGYPPNTQGIRWFADHVWPQVRRAVPDAQLDIVGRAPPPSVQALDDRGGITVVGSVRAIGPYFARAHAVVVPILTGAGIRVKVVEGMAAGRAIVSTSLGWEGLPHVQPGRHLLVADTPHDFARAAIRLLLEPALRESIASDARLLAERSYDWRGLGDEHESVLQAVTDRATTSDAARRLSWHARRHHL
jgi:glycosyltransferase involved in cell wall biosynthesis